MILALLKVVGGTLAWAFGLEAENRVVVPSDLT